MGRIPWGLVPDSSGFRVMLGRKSLVYLFLVYNCRQHCSVLSCLSIEYLIFFRVLLSVLYVLHFVFYSHLSANCLHLILCVTARVFGHERSFSVLVTVVQVCGPLWVSFSALVKQVGNVAHIHAIPCGICLLPLPFHKEQCCFHISRKSSSRSAG